MPQARTKLAAGVLAVGLPSRRDEAVLNAGGRRLESILYDFTVDGGAIGTLSFGRLLPVGALVTAVFTDEIVAVTGATSITVQAGSTALTGAINFTGDSGIHKRTLAGSADAIKIPAESLIQLAIASAPATAGQVRIYVEYMLANDVKNNGIHIFG